MTHSRRFILAAGASALALGACQEAAAPVLSLRADASPGMNPGPDGADRPVTVTVLQMSGASNFDSADVFALQNASAAVGAELVKADQIVLAPGVSVSRDIAIAPGTTVIGVTAGFRDPAGKVLRRKVPAPGADSGLVISVGPGGISLVMT
ncbi:type VI secretion system lipoprotein TssJ [Citreicella sp. C3M06]|uniref:type VI secretion system lipoprotein TssJ n=1 Tax=Citreicella sp. C3M06 TaxID=2841564 RepID=UPI002091CB02|nr:type VI secretion system lipoprotein TssJ [Citreicella sp. C3M06]